MGWYPIFRKDIHYEKFSKPWYIDPLVCWNKNSLLCQSVYYHQDIYETI